MTAAHTVSQLAACVKWCWLNRDRVTHGCAKQGRLLSIITCNNQANSPRGCGNAEVRGRDGGCGGLPGDVILHSSTAIAASATVQRNAAKLQAFIAAPAPPACARKMGPCESLPAPCRQRLFMDHRSRPHRLNPDGYPTAVRSKRRGWATTPVHRPVYLSTALYNPRVSFPRHWSA